MDIGDSRLPQPQLRRPRPRLLIDGAAVPALEVGWTRNTHLQADEWSATLRITDALAAAEALERPFEVEIQAGFADVQGGVADWASQIIGRAERCQWDWPAAVVTLSGRDLTSRLVDEKTTQQFRNQPSSAVVAKLAADAGLTACIAPTADKAGTHYSLDSNTSPRERSRWDIICDLAKSSGCDCWVSGHALYFQPPQPETLPPYVVTWRESGGRRQTNVTALRFANQLIVGDDVTVIVSSWNAEQQTTLTGTAMIRKSGENPKTYRYSLPGLTQAQAQAEAERRLADISKHERQIDIEAPGDLAFNIRGLLRLDMGGLMPAWEQDYYPSSCRHRLGLDGYRMSISAKNHSDSGSST